MTLRHFLDLSDFDTATLRRILGHARHMKASRADYTKGEKDHGTPLAGHVLGMLFEKPSTRTRLSFDMAMRQGGGQSIVMDAGSMQLGRGETVEDTARVMSRYLDAIMIRANDHAAVKTLAAHSTIPVINGLTNFSHPCQLMADVLTYEERKGNIAGATIAWVGDGNNVAVSLVHAAVRFGFTLRLGIPAAYPLHADVLAWAAAEGGDVTVVEDPYAAVAGADCVIADTFVSMGDTDAEDRLRVFAPYQVTKDLMNAAKPDAIFMHCLPAHRGEEVAAEVIDGPQSVVFDEAENRLHVQKAILCYCLGVDLS